MAFNVGDDLGNGGGEDPILADINVTPLVDVMLVLLIIFMITAPMLHQGIRVALPKADSESLPSHLEDPLILSIDREGTLFVRDTPVERDQVVEQLKSQLSSRENDIVFLKGDRDVPYGQVIEVLDLLHQGGIVNVGMVTERRGDSERKRRS